ncbi:MAG: HlyC/CorC family transporter [Planctomycetes bacterium]|nr:HlyC/CorC family transporter [Planctomycetota bacterium]MCB9869986.1 HlyC/CorC family transporter [Planctomycetota bacterium]
MTAVLVIVGLLLLNAVFVAAEFAAIGTKESRVRGFAEQGRSSARVLLPILVDPLQLDRYISACQLGITVTSLGLGAYCEYALAGRLEELFVDAGWLQAVGAHSLASALVLAVLTLTQIVIGEQAPKSLALHRPNRVAMFTVWPVVFWQRVFGFLVTFLTGCSRLVLRLLGQPVAAERHVHTRQEIDLIIASGTLEPDQQQLLQQVLDLEVVTARQLMVPRRDIVAVDIDAPVEESVQVMLRGSYTRLPVYREDLDGILGVIHTKDLARHAVETGSIKDWRRLVRPIAFVYEGMMADRLLATLRAKRTMQAIVMDEFGGVAGLVTLEDVLRHVFGEVGDEFSGPEEQPQRLADGRVRLPGRLRLDEVEDWVGVAWQGVSTTVNGFITEHLGQLPSPGQTVDVFGVEVEIEAVEKNVIQSVLARPIAAEAGGEGANT